MRTLTVALLGLIATPAWAAFDVVLSYPGIPGDNNVIPGFPDHIQVIDMDLGVFRIAENGAVASASTPKLGEVKFVKAPDSATPALMLASLNSQPQQGQVAEFKFIRTGGRIGSPQPYLVVSLRRPVVTGYALVAEGGADVPIETITLGYDQLCVTHRPQEVDGSLGPPVTQCWDATTQSPI